MLYGADCGKSCLEETYGEEGGTERFGLVNAAGVCRSLRGLWFWLTRWFLG